MYTIAASRHVGLGIYDRLCRDVSVAAIFCPPCAESQINTGRRVLSLFIWPAGRLVRCAKIAPRISSARIVYLIWRAPDSPFDSWVGRL